MEFSDKNFQRLGVVFIVSIIAFEFVRGKLDEPDKSAVNGTYYNVCCGDIIMRDGTIVYKGVLYKYEIEDMKFGRTAYLSGNLTKQGITPSDDNRTTLRFSPSERPRMFQTVIGTKEYSFLKVR